MAAGPVGPADRVELLPRGHLSLEERLDACERHQPHVRLGVEFLAVPEWEQAVGVVPPWNRFGERFGATPGVSRLGLCQGRGHW